LFLLTLTVGIYVVKRFSLFVHLKPENLVLLALTIGFAFGFVSEDLGLTAIIGSFLAGMLLGQTNFYKDLVEPLYLFGEAFFVPVFFVTTGMLLQVESLGTVWLFALAVTFAAILGKAGGVSLAARAFKFTRGESLFAGASMIPRAGVELVLLKMLLARNIISPHLAAVVLVMDFATMIVTPPLMKFFSSKAKLISKTRLKKRWKT
jgi:Kef-type K+ transport system membrane component KefB